MTKYKCENGCCMIKISPYTHNLFQKTVHSHNKAGVFIYDPNTDKVLIVQSRGQLWGPPKGTLEIGETDRVCAIREVKEETGLDISDKDFTRAITINNRATYYYLERPECEVQVQDHIHNNDVNGIGWIKLDCLEKCVQNGNIVLSKHCIKVFQKFMNKTFQPSEYTTVISN